MHRSNKLWFSVVVSCHLPFHYTSSFVLQFIFCFCLNLSLSLFRKHFYVNSCSGLFSVLLILFLFSFSRKQELPFVRSLNWPDDYFTAFNFITIACIFWCYGLMNDHPFLVFIKFTHANRNHEQQNDTLRMPK